MNTTAIEKFTPGPWEMTEKFKRLEYKYSIYAPNCINENDIICHSPRRGLNQPEEIWEANAKLIAAAPDLLQACREMVKHLTETDFDVSGTPDELLNKWKAAIKKATE